MLSEKNNKIQRNFKENYHVDFMIEEEMNYTKEEIEQIKSMLDEKINNLELEIDNLVVKEEKKLINDEFIQQKGKKEDFILNKEMLDEFKLRLNDKIDKIQLDLKNL